LKPYLLTRKAPPLAIPRPLLYARGNRNQEATKPSKSRSMIIPLLTLLAAPPFPTFEELEIDKIKAYFELKAFHEELEVTDVEAAKTYLVTRSTKMDGLRSHSTGGTGTSKVESVCDGKTSWLIFTSQASYYESKIDQTAAFDPKTWLLKADADGFNFAMNTTEPVQFACHLPLKVVSVEVVKEGAQNLRKVVASATNSKGIKLTITQWFLPDKWLVKRFSVDTGPTGPINMKGVMTTLDLHATFPATEFNLDPKMVEHFQKMAAPPSGS